MNTDLRKIRVTLIAQYVEVWSGTLADFCFATKREPAEVVAALDAAPKPGLPVLCAEIETMKPGRWLPFYHNPSDPLHLTRAHYYADPKTGNAYTSARHLRSGFHWDRVGPINVTLGQTAARNPLVTVRTGFGIDGEYTPAQIRAFAETLLRIAADAEKHPMGPRSFHRSDRGYDT